MVRPVHVADYRHAGVTVADGAQVGDGGHGGGRLRPARTADHLRHAIAAREVAVVGSRQPDHRQPQVMCLARKRLPRGAVETFGRDHDAFAERKLCARAPNDLACGGAPHGVVLPPGRERPAQILRRAGDGQPLVEGEPGGRPHPIENKAVEGDGRCHGPAIYRRESLRAENQSLKEIG